MAPIPLRDQLRESNVIQPRLLLSAALALLLTVLLVARLAWLQIINHEHYATLSQNNRIHLLPVPPVRGLLYDRNGVALSRNTPMYNLEVVPDQVPDMDQLLDGLGRVIEMDTNDLEQYGRTVSRRPGFEGQTLRAGLSDTEAARFAASRHLFTGADLQARLQRQYPLGGVTGHVLGYVGRISERDLDIIDRVAYRGTEYIGKTGIEAHYEDLLLGRPGVEQVETNAHGRLVRTLSRTPPVAGKSLYLTIDARLQTVAQDALGEHNGAVVAVEPATGDVLAFVSRPTYDPNRFVNGIDQRSYDRLRNSPDRPLLNRAIDGRYAPGSTLKPFLALAALYYGREPSQTNYCPGYFRLKGSSRRYRCWKAGGHGSVNLHEAIVQSCDVYFYQLATMLGINRMHDFLTRFGFGSPTGIDLNGEPGGLVPSTSWKREVRGQPWFPGETVSAGIGQGYMLTTPLQLATATAMLAMRGHAMRPRLVRAIADARDATPRPLVPEPLPPLGLAPEHFNRVIKAMEDVVHGQRGTARRIGQDAPYRIAGKTGTAQVIGIPQGGSYNEKAIEKRFRDHSLFIAFAPVGDPQIAIAVVAENAGSGSRFAAPIARRVMDYYLMELKGREFDQYMATTAPEQAR